MSKLTKIVESKGYKNFMSKLYGIGASVVIVGALFKITHINGADIMLFFGLITEAVIFFFSAFEKPHVEPDWSLVYPQLAVNYGKSGDDFLPGPNGGNGLSGKLDDMLKNADIDEKVMQRFGTGLKNLADTAQNMSTMASAAATSEEFIGSVKKAGASANQLSESYQKTSTVLNQEASVAGQHLNNLQTIAKATGDLNKTYTQVAETMNHEMEAHVALRQNLVSASKVAGDMVEKFNQSAQSFAQASQTIAKSATEGEGYAKQLNSLTTKLGQLNSIYETQIKYSESQAQVSEKTSQAVDLFLKSMQGSANNTVELNKNLDTLNKAILSQAQNSNMQTEKTVAIQKVLEQFLAQMQNSVEHQNKYQQQADQLTANLSRLNTIYGNMLSAMSARQ